MQRFFFGLAFSVLWLCTTASICVAKIAPLYSSTENANTAPKGRFLNLNQVRQAATKGDAEAQYILGSLFVSGGSGVTPDPNEALKWFRLAAAQGYPHAQNSLGVSFENGRGVSKDAGEALKWYTLAAAKGDANAEYNLGRVHALGLGRETGFETGF